MTLGQKILEALEETTQQGTWEGGFFPFEYNGTQVSLEVVDFDRLGFLLNSVKVAWMEPMSAPATRARAEHVARRVTYLLEDLTLVEWAEKDATALLRSVPQEMQGQGSDYFELSLRGGRTLTLHRFRPCADAPKRRQEIPFHLTADLLKRLLDDFDVQPTERTVTV